MVSCCSGVSWRIWSMVSVFIKCAASRLTDNGRLTLQSINAQEQPILFHETTLGSPKRDVQHNDGRFMAPQPHLANPARCGHPARAAGPVSGCPRSSQGFDLLNGSAGGRAGFSPSPAGLCPNLVQKPAFSPKSPRPAPLLRPLLTHAESSPHPC